MQSIITKKLPWTATNPTRIRAKCPLGTYVLSGDDLTGRDEEDHEKAAQRLCDKIVLAHPQACPWLFNRVIGTLDEDTRVHVFIEVARYKPSFEDLKYFINEAPTSWIPSLFIFLVEQSYRRQVFKTGGMLATVRKTLLKLSRKEGL